MVRLKQIDTMQIQILSDDIKYFQFMKDEFTRYVPNYQFMPNYRAGIWNGKTSLISDTGIFPYGLLLDYIKVHKKYFSNIKLKVDDKIKQLFKGKKYKLIEDLELKPYPYQKDCIEKCLRYTKGIIVSATASGKSLIISYIIKVLLENDLKKFIIVVPTISLVEQFYSDMINYGIESNIIGRVHSNSKEWDKKITISTWQTLKSNHNKLMEYECIIIDEVHQSKAYELKKILKNTGHMKYKFGFTGTMYNNDLDNWSVKSYLGPILREYRSGFLSNEGYISKCNLKMINLKYIGKNFKDFDYNEVKDIIFNNEYRMNFLKQIAINVDHNILYLVGKVEKEGDVLKYYLSDIKNKEIIFLSGRDKVELREEWRKKCLKQNNIIIIATYGIFSTGINIPNLKYMVLASPFKSKIRVIQSIGRTLRKHSNKKNGSIVFDIHDHVKYLKSHGNKRYDFYVKEGFDVKEFEYREGDKFNIKDILNP